MSPQHGHTTDTHPSRPSRWEPAGLPFSTFRPRSSAGAGGAMPADQGPSTDDSSLRLPLPSLAGGSAGAGAFHHGRTGGPAPPVTTHVAARSDNMPATTPDRVKAAAPPALLTRSGASGPPRFAAAS